MPSRKILHKKELMKYIVNQQQYTKKQQFKKIVA